jgi:class 3 adenylate cyclase
VNVAKNMSAYTKLAFLFSESACSSATHPWAVLPGSYCATFAVNATTFAPFGASYAARDVTPDMRAFSDIGFPASAIDLYATGVYPAYAVDSTRIALRALNTYARANNRLPATSAIAAALLRNTTMFGMSGDIAMPFGDRAAADMIVFNSFPNSVVRTIARVGSDDSLNVEASLFAFGVEHTPEDMPPSIEPDAPLPHGNDGTNTTVIVVVVLIAVAAMIVTGVVAKLTSKDGGRDNRDAPQDASVPFTIMFTDIEASTAQWATNPEVMGPAVDQHHDLIRKALRRHNGYEVKTIGDSFMVAFKDPVDALAASIDIQQALFSAQWPSGIDAIYRLRGKEAGLVPLDNVTYADLWSGIRVRIGVHTGNGEIKLDPVSQGYDYYGTVVNTAARVEGVGHGGQVLFTRAAYEAVKAATNGDHLLDTQTHVSHLGAQPLRGLAESVDLVQVMPVEFGGRDFPPLRLDMEVIVDDASGSESDNSGAMAASARSADTVNSRNSHYSDPSQKIPKDAPEYVCRKAAKRMPGIQYNTLVYQYLSAKAMFSVMPVKERSKLIADLASRWRIAEAKKKSRTPLGTAAYDNELDQMIARLASKAAPVAAAYHSPYVTETARDQNITEEGSASTNTVTSRVGPHQSTVRGKPSGVGILKATAPALTVTTVNSISGWSPSTSPSQGPVSPLLPVTSTVLMASTTELQLVTSVSV